MTAYRAGQWMPMTPPHGKTAVGKPEPPAKRKDRDTKPKRTKRRKRK